LIALDWLSGNRSILVDHNLTGLLLGLTLNTKTEEIYRALIEATAFGTRIIIENFNSSGVPVKEFIVAGGLLKNKYLMQMYSDILNMPISTIASSQGPALGSAIHAAVAVGAYPDVNSASKIMGGINRNEYLPDHNLVPEYDALFREYRIVHDYFGGRNNEVMHRLKIMKKNALIELANSEK
jgi:L-ribulokinase